MVIPESRTLGGLLDEQAVRHGNKPAIMFEGATWTFSETRDHVREIAKGLVALGISHGDKVALLMGNRPEWIWTCFAAVTIGAILCPMNTWYKRDELDYGLEHCEASVLVAVDSFIKRNYMEDLAKLMPELATATPGEAAFRRYPNLKNVVVLSDAMHPGTLSLDQLRARGEDVSDDELAAAASKVNPDDICYILYTSGSTAAPKAVLLQHRGAIENCFQIGERQHMTSDDRIWLVVPLFYGLASVNALPAAFTHGACVVLQEHFDAGHALEVIERHRCTVYYGLGNITRSLLDHPDFSQRDLSSLKKGVTGFSPEDKRLAIEDLGVELCSSIYGLTESYGNCAVSDAYDALEVKLTTQGKPLPGWDFKIIDPETEERLPRGQVGHVHIKGYTTLGYFKDDQATREAFDPEGYFVTGDMGAINEEGYFSFHSRSKDLIKTGGINVSPMEVEHILEVHPLVRQAHVVGVPDPVKHEVIVAFVETNGDVSEEELRDFVHERASSFKVPHHVFFRSEDEIPRLSSGKVAKIQLRQWAEKELGVAS